MEFKEAFNKDDHVMLLKPHRLGIYGELIRLSRFYTTINSQAVVFESFRISFIEFKSSVS